MKYFLVLLSVLFISCTSVPHQVDRPARFYSLPDINRWIYQNIEYEDGVVRTIDEVQTPEETLAKGSGVCIDMSVLFISLAKEAGYENTQLLPVLLIKQNSLHVLVDAGGFGVYDPTNNMCSLYNVMPKYRVVNWCGK